MKLSVSIFGAIAVLYFFFNSVFLPHGLLYTTLLSPLFYIYLVRSGERNVLGYFLVITLPWFIAHLFVGVNILFYIKSTALLGTVYLFVYAFAIFLKSSRNIERVFAQILVLNILLVAIAIVLFWTGLRPSVWYLKSLTTELDGIPRLMLFTYEPSYYSTLLVPIAVYYFLKLLIHPNTLRNQVFLLLSVAVPLILSFSLGVLSSLTFAFTVTIVYFFKSLSRQRVSFYNLTGILVLSVGILIGLLVLYPANPLFERIIDLFEGKDLSGRGRTIEAWMLSWQMLELCNHWVGCGVGQAKVVGEEVVRVFYHYQHDDIPVIRIPSAIGETLTTFGVTGVVIRLGLLVYLFFKTKVYTNYFQFTLFWYMFLYQFTGSYLTNIAEYVIWVFAFTPYFTSLNVVKPSKKLV